VNSVPGLQVTTESTALTFSSGNKNTLSVSDADTTGSMQITLSAANGTLTAVVTAGVTISNNGTGTVTLTGTQANLNTALNGLVFSPTAGFFGLTSITVTTNDQDTSHPGGPQSDIDTVSVRVLGVNGAPVNSVPAAQTFDE